jgi:hypothetical protein
MATNETIRVFFSILASSSALSGIHNENLLISCNELPVKRIPLRFQLTPFQYSELNIKLEDEYTYFAFNKPNVANAEVQLRSSNGGSQVLTQTSDSAGVVSFYNLTEFFYEIYIQADRHKSKYIIWEPKASVNDMLVFLNRIAVGITWSVTPILFEDRYEINLTSNFEAYVPIPVVVLEPTSFDLLELQSGLIEFITLKVLINT